MMPRVSEPDYTVVPCSRYNFTELAEIYNATRTDYIVPMPMNAKRMEQYAAWYDVDLDRSMVIFDSTKAMAGLGMLAVRGKRAWITRLGVLPERRGKGLGLFMMEELLVRAREQLATACSWKSFGIITRRITCSCAWALWISANSWSSVARPVVKPASFPNTPPRA